MKRVAKPVSIIIAVLILAFSVVSLFGYSYYIGDNRKTVIKGFGDIDWGIDTTGSTKLVLQASTDDEVTVGQLKENTTVIKNRLSSYGLVDYEVYYLADSSEIVVIVPKTIDCDYSSKGFARLIASKGYLTMRAGDEYDDSKTAIDDSNSVAFYTPMNTTADTVILDSSTVENVSSSQFTAEDGNKYPCLNIYFNDEGTQTMSRISNSMTGQYYNATVSIWLDDLMISNPTVSEEITDGVISVSSASLTDTKAKLYTSIIKSGPLPYDMSEKSIESVAPVGGTSVSDIFLIVGIAAVILIVFAMTYRYKMFGVIALVSMVGEVSVMVAIISGFCIPGRTFLMDISGACALALCAVLSVVSVGLMAHKLREKLNAETVLSQAVSSALKTSRRNIWDINVILIILSAVGMLMFGSAELTNAIFGGGAIGSIFNFCYVLFFGAIVNFFMGYIFPELMLRSLINFKVFNKPSCFGGKK